MNRYRRHKLRAHDLGIDRHNKPVAYERKMARLAREHTTTGSRTSMAKREVPTFAFVVVQLGRGGLPVAAFFRKEDLLRWLVTRQHLAEVWTETEGARNGEPGPVWNSLAVYRLTTNPDHSAPILLGDAETVLEKVDRGEAELVRQARRKLAGDPHGPDCVCGECLR